MRHAAALVALFALAGPSLAQQPWTPAPGERFDLTPRWEKGDRCEGEARMLMTLKVRLQLAAKNLDRTSEQAQAVLRRWQDEVAQVESSRVVEVKRRYHDDWEGLREPGARDLEKSQGPLHQRRVVIDRDERGKPRVRVVNEPALEASLLEEERAAERYEAFLPPEPVTVGQKWTLTEEELRAALGKGVGKEPTGKAECTLKEVKEEAIDDEVEARPVKDGTPVERYAIVEVKLTTSGMIDQEEAPMSAETDLTGTLRFSITRKKIVAVELTGTVHKHQTRKDGDAVLETDMKGPLELKKRFWFPERPEKKEKPPEGLPPKKDERTGNNNRE